MKSLNSPSSLVPCISCSRFVFPQWMDAPFSSDQRNLSHYYLNVNVLRSSAVSFVHQGCCSDTCFPLSHHHQGRRGSSVPRSRQHRGFAARGGQRSGQRPRPRTVPQLDKRGCRRRRPGSADADDHRAAVRLAPRALQSCTHVWHSLGGRRHSRAIGYPNPSLAFILKYFVIYVCVLLSLLLMLYIHQNIIVFVYIDCAIRLYGRRWYPIGEYPYSNQLLYHLNPPVG